MVDVGKIEGGGRSWEWIAHRLGERMSHQAICKVHTRAEADPDNCPFCDDRAAYDLFLRKVQETEAAEADFRADDFVEVTTETAKKRHLALANIRVAIEGTGGTVWLKITLCGHYGRLVPYAEIAHLPACKQCIKSRQRRLDGRYR